MNHVLLKPYKRSASTWYPVEGKERTDENGRVEWCIEIGIQKVMSEEGRELATSPLEEYVYKDVLQNMFTSPKNYTVRINLGCEPQLTIAYENRLVLHNSAVGQMVEEINSALNKYDEKALIGLGIDSLLALKSKRPLSKEFKKLTKEINEDADWYYPHDFIGFIIREKVFEQMRGLDGKAEELHLMDYAEIMENLKSSLKDGDRASLSMIKDELMYAYLLGDLGFIGS